MLRKCKKNKEVIIHSPSVAISRMYLRKRP